MTDTDIQCYRFCICSVFGVMRNNTSVGDHVTALSYQLSFLGFASIT